ncbi:ATP-binding protein [Kosakonia cowanii]|uniref:ATP-binding protein n=1 Tax=Kosakonia cowanii TaxID=208223 RepID=UPI002893CFA3|nr:ATP-binding protein [Kosakonia cowanii]MDT3411050.1 signal transduction histidine kinase/CheY-like chemotaxis protein [Atlantibacter sp. SORGH_AS_0304]
MMRSTPCYRLLWLAYMPGLFSFSLPASAATSAHGHYAGLLSIIFISMLLVCGLALRIRRQRRRNQSVTATLAKTHFLAMVSHEIRTPLNAILGILELQIAQTQHPQPMLEVAHDAAKDLLALVGDVLDMSRIESGHMPLEPSAQELVSLTRAVVLLFEEASEQKQLALRFSVVGGARCPVLIDPWRYKQILSNLVSNAIKFTREGEIRITLSHQITDAQRVAVSLSVTDTGPGIAPEHQARLFTPFVQFGPNEDGARNGSGLGLAICQALCELMAGKLTLNSTPGKGTCVTLQLTLPPSQEPCPVQRSLPAIPVSTVKGRRVMIVDDYRPNLLLLRHQLELLGHQVIEAQSGEEALATWHAHKPFDYILMDCNMPLMDGFTLAKTIRLQEQQQAISRATLLGFTAIAQQEIIEQCQQAGMDGCLFKPCSQQEIAQWII